MLDNVEQPRKQSFLGHWHAANASTNKNAYENKFSARFCSTVALNIVPWKLHIE